MPPDILDYPTSTDMVVREGSNVTMRCAATGSPEPTITWRREGGEFIPIGTGKEGEQVYNFYLMTFSNSMFYSSKCSIIFEFYIHMQAFSNIPTVFISIL